MSSSDDAHLQMREPLLVTVLGKNAREARYQLGQQEPVKSTLAPLALIRLLPPDLRPQRVWPRLGGRIRLDAFRRARIGEHTVHPVVGATLRFDQSVSGPIVLGRLAHFGLGRFAPAAVAIAPG